MAPPLQDVLDRLYRTDSRQILATLIRLLGDFDLAEDAMHDAFKAALEQWPAEGVPENPRAWLISTGRFKGIDRQRRAGKFEAPLDEHLEPAARETAPEEDTSHFPDDRLRLIFTCCHPALAPEAQVALTLREVCGLATEEIARAFLTIPTTLAQRIVRAKTKIRDAQIPYEIPGAAELPERLDAVLLVVYLVFNEGYSASAGDQVTRTDLTQEAIRLGRLLFELLPEPEVGGLLALMLLQESRRAARATADGDLILLSDQDRTLWRRDLIAEGTRLAREALASGRAGHYTVQAAIAAEHANAPKAEETDWNQIAQLYDRLLALDASPVVQLNRAVAIAMRDGPQAGLSLIDDLLADGHLEGYHLAHAARADLCRRLGQTAQARASYQAALRLAQQEPEKRFIKKRLSELPN